MKNFRISLLAASFLMLIVTVGCGSKADPNVNVPADKIAPTNAEDLKKELDSSAEYAEEMKKAQQGG